MIILPDRNIPRARLLVPMKALAWRAPSAAQPKDQFGNESVTRFRARAMLCDGHVAWCGWFDDREDFDAFAWAVATGSLVHEPALWRLPTPEWNPGIGPEVSYDFATQTILTSAGSLLSYTVPADWNNGNNKVEVLGASGGSGGVGGNNAAGGGGGGGGAYSRSTNITLSGTASYQIGSGGSLGFQTTSDGGAGGDTWFKGSTYAASSVGAKGGSGGFSGGGAAGGSGGSPGSGIGSNRFSGGTGAAGSATSAGSGGGGGAAGPSGNGGNAAGTTGGAANASTTAGPTANTAGFSGTEFSASYGCGTGGAGKSSGNGALAGGNYGGGPGGARSTGAASSGVAGTQGLIVVTYTVVSIFPGNIAMMGL